MNDDISTVECVFPVVVVSMLPHAEFGPNDHQEDAPYFTFGLNPLVKYMWFILLDTIYSNE